MKVPKQLLKKQNISKYPEVPAPSLTSGLRPGRRSSCSRGIRAWHAAGISSLEGTRNKCNGLELQAAVEIHWGAGCGLQTFLCEILCHGAPPLPGGVPVSVSTFACQRQGGGGASDVVRPRMESFLPPPPPRFRPHANGFVLITA